MNKEWAKKWVAALRSGKYQQARAKLCKVDIQGEKSYCCLGVLTQLVLDENPHLLRLEQVEDFINFRDKFGIVESDFLPKPVKDIVGLNISDPEVYIDDEFDEAVGLAYDSLSSCNDERSLDFLSIAQLIENTFLLKDEETLGASTT